MTSGLRLQPGDEVAVGEDLRMVVLDRVLGRGNEAAVFGVVGAEEEVPLAVKIYRAAPSDDLELVVRHSRANLRSRTLAVGHHNNETGKYPIVAAPRALVFDSIDTKRVIGVAMRRAPDEFEASLDTYLRSAGLKNLHLSLTVAGRITAAVVRLHESDYVIGDVSPNNFIVDPDGNVCAVDVDSFGFRLSDDFREPTSRTSNFEPPPHLRSNLNQGTDSFSLGILVLYLLLGIHPFGGTSKQLGTTSTAQRNIDLGESWIFHPDRFNLPPRFRGHPGLLALPSSVASAAAPLLSGCGEVKSAADWLEALMEASGLLETCECKADRFRGRACPTCFDLASPPPVDSRITGRDVPRMPPAETASPKAVSPRAAPRVESFDVPTVPPASGSPYEVLRGLTPGWRLAVGIVGAILVLVAAAILFVVARAIIA